MPAIALAYVGMTWLLNRVLKERQPSWRQAVEPLPTLGDRGTLIPRPSGTPFERGKARDDG